MRLSFKVDDTNLRWNTMLLIKNLVARIGNTFSSGIGLVYTSCSRKFPVEVVCYKS
jgi:hypothetical protein